ncbi:hypothetical protein [uncultured Halomonas sp.]|uniref:hypothetical protein n=1 Tax=uncultured Halomonas sp. TaxID=173971 RepID=UPI0026063F3A|nr:hypothetical protein [uncultured Halomonas sp.]
MPRHLTVVYTIHDDALFEDEQQKIFERFRQSACSGSEAEPWTITAVSSDHEIRRLELIEQALEQEDDRVELIARILGQTDIGNADDLQVLQTTPGVLQC